MLGPSGVWLHTLLVSGGTSTGPACCVASRRPSRGAQAASCESPYSASPTASTSSNAHALHVLGNWTTDRRRRTSAIRSQCRPPAICAGAGRGGPVAPSCKWFPDPECKPCASSRLSSFTFIDPGAGRRRAGPHPCGVLSLAPVLGSCMLRTTLSCAEASEWRRLACARACCAMQPRCT